MKKIALLFLFALVCTNAIAQKDFQGMAVYESKTSMADFKVRMEGNKNINPDMQKMMEERMKKMFEKTFILNFDKSASIYKEEEKLDATPQGGGGMRMMSSMTGGGGTFYKNVKDKAYTVDKEFMGKEFLVKDSLANLNWKVEAADDICYTIIDFEDGINLGLVQEEYALEYLIKLVKDSIDSAKYSTLNTKEDRISYLRALAIGSLINDAVRVFIENEEAILAGKFPYALTDKSKYKAQMDDIIKLSVKNIYQSREVIEKEIVGYQIIQTLLDKFISAMNNKFNGTASNYDQLILKMLPEKHNLEKENLYDRLLHICHFVSMLTDGNALELFETINGTKK